MKYAMFILLLSFPAYAEQPVNWMVSLMTVKDFGPRESTATLPAREIPTFGLQVQKRVYEIVFMGVQFIPENQLGFSVGLGFK